MTPCLRRLLVALLAPTSLALVLALTTLVTGAADAKAGEDFPFFCSVEGTPRSFKVATDMRSPTGYTLTLYRRNWFDARMPVEIRSTGDGKYWLVRARRMTSTLLFDRQILAYIGLEGGRTSHGDVKVSFHDADGRDWDLKPLRCGRP